MSCCMRLGPYYNKRNSGVCGIIEEARYRICYSENMVVVHPLFTGFGHYYCMLIHNS